MNYDSIPESTKETIDLWVSKAVPTGGFVYAVLCNNLKESFARADEHNTRAMKLIVMYLYNECPIGCWGSEEKVRAWAEHGGFEGLDWSTPLRRSNR